MKVSLSPYMSLFAIFQHSSHTPTVPFQAVAAFRYVIDRPIELAHCQTAEIAAGRRRQ